MKRHLGHLAFVGVLFLFVVGAVRAQPGCSPLFSAEDACAWPIPTSEYVFLGRVASVVDEGGESYRQERKFVVEVEASLKGNLRRTIALTVTDHCLGMVRVGGRHIFTAESGRNENKAGLVSRHWSTEIGAQYPKSELDALLREIRAVVNKVRQPRLVGAVVERGWYVDGRWLRRASGVGGSFANDPSLAGGHVDVVVTARRKDGWEARTATGAGGYFVFNDLPNGTYELFADLPDGYNIRTEGTFHTYEGEKKYLLIDDSTCSKKVTFSVQLQGGVKVQIRGVPKSWSHMNLFLLRVSEIAGRRELSESLWDYIPVSTVSSDGSTLDREHVFKEVPVGRYAVMLSITKDPNVAPTSFYYPGTADVDRAGIIAVEPAKTNSVEINITELIQGP